ncbi:MAG: isoprenylcysteine carboxyl methyltransferase, partial [Deltaproteobacteria bacterium]|nr:isoprenylcysteine carboxyl methyltransferase [Deltaproteobacteria bacterium]
FWMCIGLFMTYGARAWTEERHLSRDPDFRAYKKKVPYRFIPWVW